MASEPLIRATESRIEATNDAARLSRIRRDELAVLHHRRGGLYFVASRRAAERVSGEGYEVVCVASADGRVIHGRPLLN